MNAVAGQKVRQFNGSRSATKQEGGTHDAVRPADPSHLERIDRALFRT
jgi:hypothetical protein